MLEFRAHWPEPCAHLPCKVFLKIDSSSLLEFFLPTFIQEQIAVYTFASRKRLADTDRQSSPADGALSSQPLRHLQISSCAELRGEGNGGKTFRRAKPRKDTLRGIASGDRNLFLIGANKRISCQIPTPTPPPQIYKLQLLWIS